MTNPMNHCPSKKSNFRFPFQLRLAPILFSLTISLATLHAAETGYLADGKPDAIALLAPPPLPDSPEQAADMAEVQSVFHSASSNEVAAAFSERKFSVFNFTRSEERRVGKECRS